MASYEAYLSGRLSDYEFSDAEMQESLAHLPQVA
jgi:hypothetical protein